jgi:ubiquinone/menaquinone biosynthesis C-methylase UbiE
MTLDKAGGQKVFDAAPVWLSFFETFGAKARLLDLATGGGQVAGYASTVSASRADAFEVIGVDQADLGAGARGSGSGATLMGSVMLERLPFPQAHFDGASSQFGIEYADARLALAELSRVLKPGGRAMLLMHHAQSAISRSTAAQAAAHDRVLGDGAMIRQARRAFAAHMAGRPGPATSAAEQALREAVARATGRLEAAAGFDPARYIVGYLADLAERIARYKPASALARLDEMELGIASWRQRHRSQLNAALDAGGLDAFLQRASRVGLTPNERAEQHDAGGELIAWRICLTRD